MKLRILFPRQCFPDNLFACHLQQFGRDIGIVGLFQPRIRLLAHQQFPRKDPKESTVAKPSLPLQFFMVFRRQRHRPNSRKTGSHFHHRTIALQPWPNSTGSLRMLPPVSSFLFVAFFHPVSLFQPRQEVIIRPFENDFCQHNQPDGQPYAQADNLDHIGLPFSKQSFQCTFHHKLFLHFRNRSYNLSVEQINYTTGKTGIALAVCHHHNGSSFLVEFGQ